MNLDKFDILNKEKWGTYIKEKYQISNDQFVFGFVGRIKKEKGINELLFAFKEVVATYPNSVLFVIGQHDDTSSIDKNILKWSMDCGNVMYTGQVNNVEEYYSAMDVFILPSYREGFGSVVIEAEALGVPVIVSDIPGPIDAMENMITGLIVKKGDTKDLVIAMIQMIKDKSLLQFFSQNAHNFAKNNFDSKKLFDYIFENRIYLIRENKR